MGTSEDGKLIILSNFSYVNLTTNPHITGPVGSPLTFSHVAKFCLTKKVGFPQVSPFKKVPFQIGWFSIPSGSTAEGQYMKSTTPEGPYH